MGRCFFESKGEKDRQNCNQINSENTVYINLKTVKFRIDNFDSRMKGTLQKEIAEFQREFNSVIFFTYRNSFLPIKPTELTSDMGWGCMLRTGQMMIAEAFKRHFLGRNWDPFEGNKSNNIVYKTVTFIFPPCFIFSLQFSHRSSVGLGTNLRCIIHTPFTTFHSLGRYMRATLETGSPHP